METKISKSKVKDAGITMIALVVTIVVLLILASITIGAITGENGILRNANDAKEQTEIGEEKEIVDRATIQAMGNNKRWKWRWHRRRAAIWDMVYWRFSSIFEYGKW